MHTILPDLTYVMVVDIWDGGFRKKCLLLGWKGVYQHYVHLQGRTEVSAYGLQTYVGVQNNQLEEIRAV